jgi:hypothetical protein
MKKLGVIAVSIIMATAGGAYAQSVDECVVAASAAAEAAGMEVTDEQTQNFCTCIHPIVGESEALQSELTENDGFPPQGEESEELAAAIETCKQ